ncbi:MAG: anti-phage BREX system Lon protease BrxL [Spirochaetota bacterium]
MVVSKSLASSQEIAKIPRFISDYLIQKLSEKTGDEKEIARRVAEFLAGYRPENKDREWLKSRILEEGNVKVLDFFDAYTDLEEAIYYVDIPLKGIRNVSEEI